MIIKRIVAITLGASLVLMTLILAVGLLIPTSTLEKLSGNKSKSDTQAVVLDANGKPIEGAIIKENADGTKTVTDQNGNVLGNGTVVATSDGSSTPAVAGATATSTTGGGSSSSSSASSASSPSSATPPASTPTPATATPNPTAAPTPTPAPPPAPVYCGGSSPCYGPSTLNAHKSLTDCWAYNGNRVINITSFNNAYHKSRLNLLPNTTLCGNVSLANYLSGTSFNGDSRNHNSSTKNNTNSTVSPYFVGYYDASKP